LPRQLGSLRAIDNGQGSETNSHLEIFVILQKKFKVVGVKVFLRHNRNTLFYSYH
jgi:hypothetical protein